MAINKSQVLVVASAVVLCAGIYLFTDIKKPKAQEEAPVATADEAGHQHPEALDIDKYIAETRSKIADKSTQEKVENLEKTGSYKELIGEYQKLDKPLAVAYYAVKLAEAEQNVASYVKAGDYNAMLMQTAPDEKARAFLADNVLKCYQKAVLLDSTNTDNRIRLAGAYMENGSQPMQGVTILLDIVRKDSTNISAQMMLGRFGIISGQFDKAIARLEKILYLQPENSEALLLMAEAYSAQGNQKKAIELLERCKKTVSSPEAKKEIDEYIKKIKKPNG